MSFCRAKVRQTYCPLQNIWFPSPGLLFYNKTHCLCHPVGIKAHVLAQMLILGPLLLLWVKRFLLSEPRVAWNCIRLPCKFIKSQTLSCSWHFGKSQHLRVKMKETVLMILKRASQRGRNKWCFKTLKRIFKKKFSIMQKCPIRWGFQKVNSIW